MPDIVQTKDPRHPILLASSSKYRANLLKQLGLEFEQASPNINESRLNEEAPSSMVARLSTLKAEALTLEYPRHNIIASDQIAITQRGEILGKPLTIENAINQLQRVNGEKLTFLTGLCVLSPQTISNKWNIQSAVVPFHVYFRNLTQIQINNYVQREMPLDCAGSFKSEGLGISLFEKLDGEDPNALIGLPLIKLCSFLENIGISILDQGSMTHAV